MKVIIKFSNRIKKTKKVPVDYIKGRKQLLAFRKFYKPNKLCIFNQEIVNGVPIEWIFGPYIDENNQNKLLLYFHGGGYYSGCIESHKSYASNISVYSKIKVMLVDYGLAPENPFPAAINDVFSIYKWLLESKQVKSEDIIIGGDSAGGGLALSLLLKIKFNKIKQPAGAVLVSPWVDLTFSGESIETKRDKDPILSVDTLKSAAVLYSNGEDPKNPYISPLFGNLSNLPPIYIIVGTREILLDDSIRIAEKLKEFNVDVELDIWEGLIHAFPILPRIVPESKEAIERISNFIREKMNIE